MNNTDCFWTLTLVAFAKLCSGIEASFHNERHIRTPDLATHGVTNNMYFPISLSQLSEKRYEIRGILQTMIFHIVKSQDSSTTPAENDRHYV